MAKVVTQTTTDSPLQLSDDSPSATIKYVRQAEKLSHLRPQHARVRSGTAVEAEFITPQDPVIVTAGGKRLPGVPLVEASKLNHLKAESEKAIEQLNQDGNLDEEKTPDWPSSPDSSTTKASLPRRSSAGEGSLRKAMPPSRTHPLFPPLPLYGPSSLLRDLQCLTFRISSFFLSLAFLSVIVLGSIFTSIPLVLNYFWLRFTFRDPAARRPFYEEEKRRKRQRKEAARSWKRHSARRRSRQSMDDDNEDEAANAQFVPTEGGKDPLVCDVAYYARRVGLEVEKFKVQTEDGFVIELWHVYNPLEFTPMSEAERAARGPNLFTGPEHSRQPGSRNRKKPKFPVLMIHGLLQSSGAYCTNDDDSLAFYLCKAGYDVWLGNNRCGFDPEHTLLKYSDPRMWAWNIRQMGVMDLPALTSRVLFETGFSKIGLIAHSQGTTQTLVALAKEQRLDLGEKLTVFCALAPAAYAGPLIGKAYFKFMRVISPAMFRLVFGIHAFIPLMMTMHRILPGRYYGFMGYRIFSFLFNWSDSRWERDLRDRMFQFAPVYVSAESMRWWLGRECFAKHKCILATREEGQQEDAEDEMDDYYEESEQATHETPPGAIGASSTEVLEKSRSRPKGSTAWYNAQVPPFALWVCGSDDLVDGRRLLRRFARGREPYVRLVHQKVIEEYEHLDVIWAMDSIERVGKEVKEVLWRTCNVREDVQVPLGCEDVDVWVDPGVDQDGFDEKKDEVVDR